MAGRIPGKLAHPPKGEEVVISGLAGVYPKSKNVRQLFQNLLEKVDAVSDDNPRWKGIEDGIPKGLGQIEQLEKFDAVFFGIHHRQANTMDCLARILLEKAVEAVYDAGMNLEELRGSKTGVYLGLTYTESERVWLYQKLESKNFCVTGQEATLKESFFSNRISYWLQLNGPSQCLDTGCNSSIVALESAYKAIREGECDAAIVGTGNVCLSSSMAIQFKRLGALSNHGKCKSFDADADGYVRSESVCVVLLQKAKDSRRVYAKVVHAKSNTDGYKEEGLGHPSATLQQQLFEEVYREANVQPSDVTYIETHGTGTRVGDLQEVLSIDRAYCKGRTTPLLIGSVKTNIGHCESASGLCSLSKVLLAMENGVIPPNLHYKTLRPELVPIKEGRLVVVTEQTPIADEDVLFGLTCFGFGGVNSHMLLRNNPKTKVNDGKPKDDVPRLVCVSGREEASVLSVLDDVKSRSLDAEFIGLLHNTFRYSTSSERYRGYAIMSKSGELCRKVQRHLGGKPEICFLFSNFSPFSTIPAEWFDLPAFKATLVKISDILKLRGIHSLGAFEEPSAKNAIYTKFMLGFSFQVALFHILKEIGVHPDHIKGVSHGRFIAAYSSNILTLEQTVLCLHILAQQMQIYYCNNTDFANLYVEEAQNQFGENLLKNSSALCSENGTDNLLREKLQHYFKQLADGFSEPLPRNVTVLEFGQSKAKCYKFQTHLSSFFVLLGNIYLEGIDIDLESLYPKVEYPVSRGTPSISPLIKWNHDQNWFVAFSQPKSNWLCSYRFSAEEKQWSFLLDRVIDETISVHLSGYLYFVWKTFSSALNMSFSEAAVVFENLKCLRATVISHNSNNQLDVTIQKKSGRFEVTENGTVVFTGNVYVPKTASEEMVHLQPLEKCDKCLPLLEKDIYKEFRLRGYQYRSAFRTLKKCDSTFKNYDIEWNGNFICYIDGMLQTQIPMGTRSLVLPTRIERIVIDPKEHFKGVEEFGKTIPVRVSEESRIISARGIQITGVTTTTIQRSDEKIKPTLEKHVFVPNETTVNLQESIRINMQIVLENFEENNIKVLEVTDKEEVHDLKALPGLIVEALSNEPVVKSHVTVEMISPSKRSEGMVVIASRPSLLQEAYDATKTGGFIISTETKESNSIKLPGLEKITSHDTEAGKLILLRKTNEGPKPLAIDLSDKSNSFNWLPRLQEAISYDRPTIVYAQSHPTSGVMGLVKSLRKEPNGRNVTCVFTVDEAPKFDENLPFYREQLKKGLAFNVFKDGKWGTYRHLLLKNELTVTREHCEAVVGTKEDLSSIRWAEGTLTSGTEPGIGKSLVHVYYAGIDSKDVMLASGKFGMEVESAPGFEFSGRDSSGRRVMGMVSNSALASTVAAEKRCLVDIPDEWTMEDAATVPFVYITALYALCVRGEIKRRQSLLILGGTGGVGQAAINIALHYDCEIFVTVGTEEERRFIREHFPHLALDHIGLSRDTTFERTILKATKGRGVHLVLNSLSDETLPVSPRCLTVGGKFLKIIHDTLADNCLNLELMRRGASFHGVTLERFFEDEVLKSALMQRFKDGVKKGVVKPMKRTVFNTEEVEEAFRYVAEGKHMGKVVVKFRNEELERECFPHSRFFETAPRFFSDPNGVYVITGGLGGFAMELADWLVLRGARNLVLSTRSGIKNGYQAFRIRTWKSLGVNVQISTANITKEEGCLQLLRGASSFGPIKGIFHLAMVLGDTTLENQTVESFTEVFKPKSIALEHLDRLSSQHCPDLNVLVAFSTLCSGRGNPGQTNYCMTNSTMERICEQRKRDGLPALAIQWGPMAEAGVVAEVQIKGAALQQRISSCLSVLEKFLAQNEPVVSSTIVNTAKNSAKVPDNLVGCVANAMGIRDLKTISEQSTLSELGLDSLMATEMKKTLESKFQVVVSVKDLRSLTFEKLRRLDEERQVNSVSPI